MVLQGTQRDVLQTIAEIQQVTAANEVEDVEIADEADLDIRLVRNTLDTLARRKEVKLEKTRTLFGIAYSAFLTKQGKAALTENRGPISEKL